MNADNHQVNFTLLTSYFERNNNFAVMSTSLREHLFFFDLSGSSLNIALSNGCFAITCSQGFLLS